MKVKQFERTWITRAKEPVRRELRVDWSSTRADAAAFWKSACLVPLFRIVELLIRGVFGVFCLLRDEDLPIGVGVGVGVVERTNSNSW